MPETEKPGGNRAPETSSPTSYPQPSKPTFGWKGDPRRNVPPWPDYNSQSASQITSLLAFASSEATEHLIVYEENHKVRPAVLTVAYRGLPGFRRTGAWEPSSWVEWMHWAKMQFTGEAAAKCVLLVLASHSDEHGRCWPSQRTLRLATDLPDKSLRRALDRLSDLKLIEVTTKTDLNGWPRNTYRLLARPTVSAAAGELKPCGQGDPRPVVSPAGGPAVNPTDKNNQKKNNQRERLPTSTANGSRAREAAEKVISGGKNAPKIEKAPPRSYASSDGRYSTDTEDENEIIPPAVSVTTGRRNPFAKYPHLQPEGLPA